MSKSIAILIPCFNEAIAIGSVIAEFKDVIPEAVIYVYDNNSMDATYQIAKDCGVVVRREYRQGKGNVIRRMFADIDADIYLLVDGDGTYDAKSSRKLINAVYEGPYDLVNARRVEGHADNYRCGHRLGNLMLTGLVSLIFSREFSDMLSGYKVLSRRFVKSFPAMSAGFEIETELTVHALEMKMSTFEMDTPYFNRPVGSESKLSTFKDGFKILRIIINLIQSEKPLEFYSTVSMVLCALSACYFYPVLETYLEIGLVPRIPTLISALTLVTLAALSFIVGLIQQSITLSRRESKRLSYLSILPPKL